MAAKYQLITELYQRTGVTVARNPQAWQGFLSSACRNYKCRFDEQLLIYAQRPDATAVTTIEVWNKLFKRWVNKDSRGIAVFDTKGRRNTLKYYFDVSDTHEGYYGSRPVPIWQMDKRYEQAVTERLSDRFGEVESTDLASVLMETARNAVEDNLQDYTAQLKTCTESSFLEGLDDFNIEVMYRELAVNSVAFMLMARCGIDTAEYFDREDFGAIVNFNTPQTLNAIGIATSDIAEMALREISLSIRNVQIAEKGQNRTFAPKAQNRYDIGRQQPERSENNERNHLHQTGGLPYTRPHITDRARASAWQIRIDAQGLSGETQEGDLPQPADIGQAERTPAPDRADGVTEVGASDKTALQGAGRDGGTERESTHAVGTDDKQHPQPSGGGDSGRADLQLTEGGEQLSIATEEEVRANLPTVDEQIEMMVEAEDEKSSAFAISQEDIDTILTKGSGFQDSKYRIYRQFWKHEDSKSNIAFLKNEYGTGGSHITFSDGTEGYAWHDGKGISIDRNGISTEHDLVLSWSKVEKRLRKLIKDNRYLNPKEKDHYADFLEGISAPQYEIDTQRKMARQRFIDANRDLPPADKRDTLSLRLSDFIRDLDGYEKALLEKVGRTDLADVTAERMEQVLSDPAAVQQLIDFLSLVKGATTSVYSRSNAWRFSQELTELHPLCYLYHEGDVVYIGADKYEISDFNENAVSLRNPEFPLFGKELSRADFEEKLRENPANDHLKTVITESQKTETLTEEKTDSLQFSIGFSEHTAFYDRQHNDRFTDLSFALGNKLLGILDEKQHRERLDKSKGVGWYKKTDFEISAVIGGEDFHYEGRFDIGDGEGDLIAHIKNFYDYCLSPNCPFIPEWKRQGEDYYREQMETLRFGRDVFIPFLEQHTELTQEDEKLLAEIMATEPDWNRKAEDKAQPEEEKAAEESSTVDEMLAYAERIAAEYETEPPEERFEVIMTSDAFPDPEDAFAIWDNIREEYYAADDGKVLTYPTEEEAETGLLEVRKAVSDKEAKEWLYAERVKQGVEPAPSEPAKEDNSDLIGTELTIDNRRYLIESIGEISGDVSMRDITFQNNVGFPINRVEKIGYVRRLLEQSAKQPEPALPTGMLEKLEAVKDSIGYGDLKADIEVLLRDKNGDSLVGIASDEWLKQLTEMSAEDFRRYADGYKKGTLNAYRLLSPSNERKNFRITDDTLGVGGAKEKFRNNMAAVNLLHELQLENRLATPEEQETLAKYVGWGGLSMAFDENNAAWADEFKELYASLSPEEYRAAKESTLTAFYTPPVVIKAMYEALDRLGFSQGSILEIILLSLIQSQGIIKKCAFAV